MGRSKRRWTGRIEETKYHFEDLSDGSGGQLKEWRVSGESGSEIGFKRTIPVVTGGTTI